MTELQGSNDFNASGGTDPEPATIEVFKATVAQFVETRTEKFFEAYANAVNTRAFSESPLTKWYAPSIVTRSETLKEFHGVQAMADWMRDLFIAFERINHIPETYLEYRNPDGTVTVHATFLRHFWLKGNKGEEPDSNTPVAWFAKVEPAETEDGYDGLHWKELQLFWDKTKLVELFEKLPSDK
ncbi:hypothetical protein M409DRAFT_29789 [Zasmidium cellare ATCC 36951]|uniref:SnoaL-like domain-containing protein n=1 Tax=Zasmidium cellare ATCC 36951 TaxID=1080233 RepID=A0A6A6C0V6_ZASCE|nr:uncharacterized protein M409DRAFT_29789 [Zasmidium cellare ATCC 36951]KAF2159790.1 hypothetical protein M409DRAFT_29789 [Zasmidium cellare ATCC 36951]